MALVLHPTSRLIFSARNLAVPVSCLCPKASTNSMPSVSSHTYRPSASFTPSDTATTTDAFFLWSSSTFFIKESTSKVTSGRNSMSGPSQSSPFARAAAPVSQPAFRPIISRMVTFCWSYTRPSRITSFVIAPIYLAALPYPGVWSVAARSLSMVLGTPIKRILLPFNRE